MRGPDEVIASLQLTVGANEYLPVYVSNVMSPGHFWFQLDGEQYHRLVELMEMLQYDELLHLCIYPFIHSFKRNLYSASSKGGLLRGAPQHDQL